MYAVISGDLIASSSLHLKDKQEIEKNIADLFILLEKEFQVYARLIKGDYLECVIPRKEDSLVVALIIKCFLKSIRLKHSKDSLSKWYKIHAIRLAIGIGSLERFDPIKNRVDGEAIYLSGRSIQQQSTHHKKRVIIKRTLFFASTRETLNETWNTIFELIDFIISKATAKQSRILYLKLLSLKEQEIANQLHISQSVVNQQSVASGWNSLEQAISYYNNALKN